MLRLPVLLFLLLAVATSGLVEAAHATDVSGTITTQTWTKANSPYHATGTIAVPAGNTLTIEPGVDVLCDSAVSFVVEGTLLAIGTPQDSIRFLKSGENYWGGMTFGGSGNLLAFVRVSGGDKGGGDGGGLSASSGFTDIRNSVISGNKATRGGGVSGWSTTLRVTDCTISDNYGVSHGGGVHGTVTISGCSITGNWGRLGGGIANTDGTVAMAMVNCVVSRNGAWEGGGVWSTDGVVTMSNCTIANNSAGSSGGGFYFLNYVTGGHPLTYHVAQVTLTNCTIFGNSAANNAFRFGGNVTAKDCIFWGQAWGYWPASSTYSDYPEAVSGVGNISADPLFVDAENGDFRLMPGSPCIGTGSLGDNMGAWPALSDTETVISSDVTWTKTNSPYRIARTVVVDINATLTIEPGVDVLFDADVQFLVKGKLHAVGTTQDSVRFLPGNAASWRGIRILSLSDRDTSTIAYTRVSGANAKSGSPNDRGGGLYVSGWCTRVGMSNAVVSGNAAGYGGGICCDNGALLTLADCVISDNTAVWGGGLCSTGGGSLIALQNCSVKRNAAGYGGGLYVSGSGARTDASNTDISGNTAPYGGGGY